ncbi:homocysteine S-methyltransferase [Lentilactobacillus sunkii]|uniref:Homocysteine S-methyltransferase n=1 Tax=Lentilactobacillus sunkii TaxID=481719 RepID=A0A1E7XGA2_9LACO|nr:homocysteine S-methyltransferase [Lentilactobacillus sunkii]
MANLLLEDLKNQKTLILDGAMATELEKRGVDTDSELWSAAALMTDPQAVKDVHKSYFESGADVAITNTYQANLRAFEAIGYTKDQASEMIVKAVKLAQSARDDFYSSLSDAVRKQRASYPLIAGSVGPFGAYLADGSEYTGDYDLSQGEYQAFHEPRMSLLAEAGVDLFAFETQPNFEESKAIGNLLETKFANYTG